MWRVIWCWVRRSRSSARALRTAPTAVSIRLLSWSLSKSFCSSLKFLCLIFLFDRLSVTIARRPIRCLAVAAHAAQPAPRLTSTQISTGKQTLVFVCLWLFANWFVISLSRTCSCTGGQTLYYGRTCKTLAMPVITISRISVFDILHLNKIIVHFAAASANHCSTDSCCNTKSQRLATYSHII